jgi:hypothetical protein
MTFGAFTTEELKVVADLQDEFRVGVYIVAPGFRVGLRSGASRALQLVRESADLPEAIAKLEDLLS